MTKDTRDTGHDNVMRESREPEGLLEIKGYDFNNGVDYDKILDSYLTSGFQASHLARAIEIIKKMRKEKVTIFLGYTSNMVTSGLREVFRYLTEHKLVDVIVTTAGGIEEDFIKCFKPFLLGRFDADGAKLREDGVNRTGNIFLPNSRYVEFEAWLQPILKQMAEEQKETGKVISPSDFIARLGKEIDNKESIYYWAQKNNIPVFCPALTDGAIGDNVYFFKYKHPDFMIDITSDIKKITDFTIECKKTGLIILGAGMIKHHILNANMMRNGADYSVYINNAQEFDGSDAGARPEEAVSWGKLVPHAEDVKVFGDVTILFPLIVAKAFVKEN